MRSNQRALFGLLFLLAVLALVFPLEFPLKGLGSKYASINTIDFVVLIIFSAFIVDNILRADWEIRLTLPATTKWLIVVSGWIVVTLLMAYARSPQSILASTLWTLKWFEVISFFIIAQNYLDQRSGKWVFSGFFITGTILVILSMAVYQFANVHRIRIFFDNPNTLSAFFNLISAIGIVFAIDRKGTFRILSVGAVLLSLTATLLTGSRGGILGLIVVISVLFILLRDRLRGASIGAVFFGAMGFILTAPFILSESIFRRLTGWIQIENGALTLANNTAARSFRIRLELMDKALDLFLQQPIFGYGWYASPSRVGYLDVHYTTLLVELGIIGVVLVLFLYIAILRQWVNIRKTDIIGSAGTAWFVSLLAQNIGGNFTRTPQILFILLLLLAAATAITNSTGEKPKNNGGENS